MTSFISAWIWSETFWLPENVWWAELERPPAGVEHPRLQHMLCHAFPLAVGVLLFRLLFERMSDADLEDNSSSSIYNIIPYPEDLLDGVEKDIPGFSHQHQDSLCSASVSSDEQSDAQPDMKNWETAEDDDADSICSCISNRSMDVSNDFQTEDPPDGQESDLDTESQNSLHEQNPSEEKESEDDNPSGGRNRFTENKNSNDSIP